MAGMLPHYMMLSLCHSISISSLSPHGILTAAFLPSIMMLMNPYLLYSVRMTNPLLYNTMFILLYY